MRNNGPAGLPRRETPTVSPVLTSEDGWLGDDDRNQPLTLQLRLPVSAEELAAALYDDHQLCPADLAADENVWGFAAAAIVRDGLSSVPRRGRDPPRRVAGNPGPSSLAGNLPSPRCRGDRRLPAQPCCPRRRARSCPGADAD